MYPSDLSDSSWKVIETNLEDQRKRKHSLREIFNAIFYVTKTGIPWRYLPKEYPKWELVYYYFSQWSGDGTLESVHDAIVMEVRKKRGKEATPSPLLLDSQSVKTSSVTTEKGFDGNKKIQGRKRFILTDTLGLIWAVKMESADTGERAGAKQLFALLRGKCPGLKKILADQGFNGKDFIHSVLCSFGYLLEIVAQVAGTGGFQVLPKRWIVERTFGWFAFNRRLPKDYETKTEHSTAFIYCAMLRIMVRRF